MVISTVVTTVLVTIIGRKGWDRQSSILKATFYGFFFCSTLLGIFINVFDFSRNSTYNISKYFYLNNMQTNVYDALARYPVAEHPRDSVVRDSLLSSIFSDNNKNLKENTNLFLDIKTEASQVHPILARP